VSVESNNKKIKKTEIKNRNKDKNNKNKNENTYKKKIFFSWINCHITKQKKRQTKIDSLQCAPKKVFDGFCSKKKKQPKQKKHKTINT